VMRHRLHELSHKIEAMMVEGSFTKQEGVSVLFGIMLDQMLAIGTYEDARKFLNNTIDSLIAKGPDFDTNDSGDEQV